MWAITIENMMIQSSYQKRKNIVRVLCMIIWCPFQNLDPSKVQKEWNMHAHIDLISESRVIIMKCDFWIGNNRQFSAMYNTCYARENRFDIRSICACMLLSFGTLDGAGLWNRHITGQISMHHHILNGNGSHFLVASMFYFF